MNPMRALGLVLLLLLVVSAACSGDAGETDAAEPAGEEAGPVTTDDAADVDDGTGDVAEGAGEDPAGIGGGTGNADATAPPAATAAVARDPERVIREGSMTIEVLAGEFRTAFAEVIQIARRLGGTSVSSSARTHEDGSTAGTVTIRVPVERYDDLLTGMDGVGTVRAQDITSTDVTAEYTDLESRLRHARAQEAFYLELLEEAQGVQDAIAVKQQLDGIQAEIEQVQGRLNVLEDRTSFSTLSVELLEPGASPIVPVDERPTIASYWDIGLDGFITVVGSLIVIVVAMAPLVALAVVAFLAWRANRRRERPATVAAGPPPA